MKPQNLSKHPTTTAATARKSHVPRISIKSLEHRYERRKLREQLRHLDWALAGED